MLASMLTYSCVTGFSCAMRSGNCAFVTRKEEIFSLCSSATYSLM